MKLTPGLQIRAQALLFDMDGTLVNSIAVIERLWRAWALRHGVPLEALLALAHGRPTIDTMRLMAPHIDHESEAAEYTRREIAETEGVIEVAGARKFLGALPPRRWAIVTSANRDLASARLGAAGISMPDVVVTVDDIERPKPHPDCYLAAARQLGVSPQDCLVFEDAPAGLASARAAGIRSVAVATTLSPDQLALEPWIDDFSQLSVREEDSSLLLTVI
jgi:sugar-phosphatase